MHPDSDHAPRVGTWEATVLIGWVVAAAAAALLLHQRHRHRAALAEARAREARLQTIVSSEPACVKTVTRDLRLDWMNPAGLAAIEADSMQQVQGADLRDVVHPDHLDDFVALNDRVFAGESVFLRFRIVGLKGTERWMETYAAPLRDGTGNVVSHVAVTHDVSARVAMEQRLLDAHDAAIAGTRAKSEFLANMSHEIRTPMTAILGWTEVLRQRLAGDDDAAEKLAIVEQSGRHLLALLDDLLDLSRIEAGKAAVARDTVDPAALLRETRTALLPKTACAPVELRIDTLDPLPQWIVTDRTRVRQVLINLANNAIKFTERGEVVLRARVDDRCDERTLVFEVEDTGPGIAKADLERVCIAFEQADSSASRRHGGVGLGLAISRSIADLLGGSLGLTSEPGVGTTARLRLPLVEAEAPGEPDESGRAADAAEPSADEAETATLAGRRILLAEDGAENQRLLAFLLRRAGCELELAADGREAIELVDAAERAHQPFELILMDVQMPVLDGHAATRALRERGTATPIVALTAHAMVGDRERALEAGCDGYLTKPIRAHDLYAEIARQLAGRSAST